MRSLLKKSALKAFGPLLDFVFPPRCTYCEVPIHPHDVLCPSCMGDLIEWEWSDDRSDSIREALHVPLNVSEIRVGYVFEEESGLQRCIHEMKYRGLFSTAFWFGRLLGERLIETNANLDDAILVPVPLNKLKQIERGYNQSEWLCRGIAFETMLPVRTDLIVRSRYTKSQAQQRLNADERTENVKDAFLVPEEKLADVRGARLILIDDLITTGATMNECVNALLAAGAGDVSVLALAAPMKQEELNPAELI